MSVQTEMLSVRGGMFNIHLRRAGAGEPLLFLHNSGGQGEWAPFLDQLAEHYTVLVPEHPGWGKSDGLEHIDDIVDLALFYLDFLDTLGISSAHIVGSSLGGMLAAEMAVFGQSYVKTLTLANAAGLWLDDAQPLDFFVSSPEELAKALYFDATMAPPPPDPTDIPAMNLRYKNRAAAAKFLWPIWDKGLKKRIHRITAPTLVLWGEADGLIPPVYADEFHRLIPGSKLVCIEKAGHLPQTERPEEFVAAIHGFIEGASWMAAGESGA